MITLKLKNNFACKECPKGTVALQAVRTVSLGNTYSVRSVMV